MSARQTIFCSCGAVFGLANAAVAQVPATPVQPTLPGEREFGQPVMDRPIIAHVIFNELEGRWNGTNTEFRWDGQGWVGTDYDKLWIKSEGTLQSNGTLEDGQPAVPLRPRHHDLFRSARRAAQRRRLASHPQLGGARHTGSRPLLLRP